MEINTVSFLDQVKSLSYGTYCSLTGYNTYAKLDIIKNLFEEYCENNHENFTNWVDAWNTWKTEVCFEKLIA